MSADGFADPVLAQRMRDVVTRQLIKDLDQLRPDYQYGEVTQIDPDLGSCLVKLTGDSAAVRIPFGESRPHTVGQIVRVGGKRGDRHIIGVMGGAVSADPDPADLGQPQNFDMGPTPSGVNSHWDPVDGASKYELQHADDAAFSINVRSYETISNTLIETPLTSGQLVYGRVRALTSYGGAGPWSVTDSTTAGFFDSTPTDGTPPSASPAAIVTGALGFLLIEWLPTSNVDLVTYEVHLSSTNGFTPSMFTKVGETTGTFFTAKRTNAGFPLVYGTTYYARIIARDADGSAAPGAQGSAAPLKVGAGDVTQIPLTEIGDGAAPASSPTPVVTNGIGYLFIKWTVLATLDYTVYDVHVSTVNGFTPSSATLVGGTIDDFFFIKKQGTGAGSAVLDYGTTYYVKIIARDIDGQAAASAQATGTPVQANTPDIAVGAITAASAIIADLAVGTAKIQDAAITTAKVGLLQVTTALIADLNVSTAKIADAAIATAKIGDLQVTDAKISTLTATKITAGMISAQNIALGTGGQLYSGSALTGGAGFVLNDQGLSLYNSGGTRLIYLDATTGDGSITGGTITGALIRTAVSGQRMELSGAVQNQMIWYSGSAQETTPGGIIIDTGGTGGSEYATAQIHTPRLNGGDSCYLALFGGTADGSVVASQIVAHTWTFSSEGNVRVRNNLEVGYGPSGGSAFGHGMGSSWGLTMLAYDGEAIVMDVNSGNLEFYSNGSLIKTFVIQHPTDNDKWLVHGAIEGPEAAVYYRGRATLINGLARVDLPLYFEAATALGDRTVQVTPVMRFDKPLPSVLAATEVHEGCFFVGGDVDCEFFWEVKALRNDVPRLQAEVDKRSVDVHGDGPYRYLTEKLNNAH